MNSMDTLRFPFLGVRENGEPFEYLLENIDQEKALISTSKWMVNHYAYLNLKEEINLFIPSFLTLAYPFRHNTPGVVTEINQKVEEQSYFYKISFDQHVPIDFSAHNSKEFALFLSSELSLLDLASQLMKDILILKQGIYVYLKHLAPYFSRIVDYSYQDYQSLENFIFDDVKKRIEANMKNLHTLYTALTDLKNLDSLPLVFNLEQLRENVETEISLDLFLAAFANLKSKEELMDLLRNPHYQGGLRLGYFYVNYLLAIKDLEKRLYSNYNLIVLIYLKSI